MEEVMTCYGEQITYDQLKTNIGEQLNRCSDSFVKIGYLLRVAQDTNILDGSGYYSVWDFAKGEFGLEESQTSRFININKRFSAQGYSNVLAGNFQHFGWAKLSIMLTLPDNVVEQISPEYSKSEIQQIAAEVKEELSPEAPSDLEVMMENPAAAEQPMYAKAIFEIMHQRPSLFKEVMEARDEDEAKEAFIPLGEATYFVRLEGIGKVMVSMNGAGAAFTAVRSGAKEDRTWDELTKEFCGSEGNSMESLWMLTYGEEAPEELKEKREEETKAAPEKKTEKKPEKKPEKKTRVEVARKSENRPQLVKEPEIREEPETEEIAPVQEAMETYLDQLWKVVHDYGEMISEETDVNNVRKYLDVIRGTCDQIEEAEE